MDTAWISAFSAVMGSLVGGFTSFVTTYASQRNQYRRDFVSKQFTQREMLYSEFINEAARLQVESLDRQMEKASTLVNIYALENRIRLNASEQVVQAAAHTIEKIVESYKRLARSTVLQPELITYSQSLSLQRFARRTAF